MSTTLELHRRIVERFLEDTHSGRLEVIDVLVDPAIVTHGFPGADPDSRASYRRFFEELDAAFDDLTITTHAMVAEGDLVSARFTVRGRHVGDYLGVAATGRPVDFDGAVIYRMSEARIAETWLFPDNLTLLTQLGVLEGQPTTNA